MANYTAHCRTNHFKVKDNAEFLEAMQQVPDVQVEENNNGEFCLLGNNSDGAGWPSFKYTEHDSLEEAEKHPGDECEDFDLPEFVSKFLAKGQVAVFMESGSEKLRYVIGYATAINSEGKRKDISLQDIYKHAIRLAKGGKVTPCEY